MVRGSAEHRVGWGFLRFSWPETLQQWGGVVKPAQESRPGDPKGVTALSAVSPPRDLADVATGRSANLGTLGRTGREGCGHE